WANSRASLASEVRVSYPRASATPMILSSSSTLPLGRRGSHPSVSQAASNQSRASPAACAEGTTSTDRSTVRRASKMTVTSLRMADLPVSLLPAFGGFPGHVHAISQRATHHVEQRISALAQFDVLRHGGHGRG